MRYPGQSKRKDRSAGYELLSNALSQFKGSHSIPMTDLSTLKSENIKTKVQKYRALVSQSEIMLVPTLLEMNFSFKKYLVTTVA